MLKCVACMEGWDYCAQRMNVEMRGVYGRLRQVMNALTRTGWKFETKSASTPTLFSSRMNFMTTAALCSVLKLYVSSHCIVNIVSACHVITTALVKCNTCPPASQSVSPAHQSVSPSYQPVSQSHTPVSHSVPPTCQSVPPTSQSVSHHHSAGDVWVIMHLTGCHWR